MRKARVFVIAFVCFACGTAQAASWCSDSPEPDAVIQALQHEVNKNTSDQPRAIEGIHTEGTLPHQGIWAESVEARKDLPLMRDLALIWRKNHDQMVLNRLATLLDAWASIYQPSFNPIDETQFDSLIDAYAIAQANLPAATREKVTALLHAWGTGYIEQMQLNRSSSNSWINNWESHRIKLATMTAMALGDNQLFAAAREQFYKQLGQNLHPDGESMDFGERDALHYQVYDLEPLVRAAMAAHTRGEDWMNMRGENGATLAAGLNWLLPYARGEKTHQEFVHSTVKFDSQRADAGMKDYSGPWDPKKARDLYWTASTLDPRYQPIAQALGNEPAWISACWPTH